MEDSIIEIDLKILEDAKSREERKANGRFGALLIAILIIILAIYHAWIRRTAVLAGILVPALIMILYGVWVVFLTKRYKKRRLLMARQMEETARREIAAIKLAKINNIKSSKEFKKNDVESNIIDKKSHQSVEKLEGKHKKRKHKRTRRLAATAHSTNKSGTSSKKRSSVRFKFLKPNAIDILNENEHIKLPPYLCRTNSAPV